MQIQEHVPLAPLTMFRIGGAAHYYVRAVTLDDIKAAIRFAHERKLPYFVLGGGSNVLISDAGWNGIVIHMETNNIVSDEGDTLLIADAGVSWDKLVDESVRKGKYGIENLSGIPGSVGGATVGNIGAYGKEVRETILWVEVFDTKQEKIIRLTNAECNFAYRESVFKAGHGQHLIILRTAFKLSASASLDKGYKDVALYEQTTAPITSLRDMREAVLAIRARKFPKENGVGTAGSYFKNPVVDIETANAFKRLYPDAPIFDTEGGKMKLSAAWIIDHVLHMRGVREGNVGTWESQALVLINYGGARASEVTTFAKTIVDRAFEATGVKLHPEVIFVGE